MPLPPLEVADLIRAAGNTFIERSRRWLTWQHVKVLLAIERCRTAALGGHIDECSRCGHRTTISYNSCIMGSNSLWGVRPASGRFTGPLNSAWLASTHHKIGPSCYCGSGHLPQSHKERPCWRSTFPRRRRCAASGVESVDHTSTRSQMTSNAMDMPRPTPCDTFVPPPISAASFIGKAVV